MLTYTPVLGRHAELDPRSRAFPARKATTLKTITHRHYGGILDQGQIGACTGNAAIDALMTAPFHVTGRTLTETDALAVYHRATILDNVPGTYPPSDTGSTGLAAAKACVEKGWIHGYTHAFGLAEVLAALVLAPVMVGTNWTQDMFTPNASGYVRPTGAVAGGHEYCLVGLDIVRKRVTALNSWSAAWGLNGRFYLTWDDLGTLLAAQGDATVLTA